MLKKYLIKHWDLSMVLLIIIIGLSYGLFWIAAALLAACLLELGFRALLQKTFGMDLHKALVYVYRFAVLVYILKYFVLSMYKVPSNSMEDAIIPNDVIVVDKLYTGRDIRVSSGLWHSQGYAAIKRNDVLVYLNSDGNNFVKRCMGLPGDKMSIRNGELMLDSLEFPSHSVQHYYILEVADKRKFYREIDSVGLTGVYFQQLGEGNSFKARLNAQRLAKIKECSQVLEIGVGSRQAKLERPLFSYVSGENWSPDHMGPFKVPQKGWNVKLDPRTYALYKDVIGRYENNNIEQKGCCFYLKGKKVNTYTFEQDYFFFLGDNRDDSVDSRFYGFTPASNIIGKARFVAFATCEDGIDWDRAFTTIR